MRQVNIGLFNESFPPLMDGVAVCVQNSAYWMQKKVGKVEVVTPHVSGADYSAYEYRVKTFPSVPVPGRKPFVTGIPELSPSFLAHAAHTNFKIVHAHSPFLSGKAALHIARYQGIPCVATFHSKFKDDFAPVMPGFAVDVAIGMVVKFFDAADQVWIPQESVLETLREYGYQGGVVVMENGCDLVRDYPESFFTRARVRLDIAPEEFVMLYVGQHIWQKNTRLIIDALEKVADLSFRMFFVGEGYAAEEMKRLVKEKGLEDKVTFTGVITDRERLVDYYAASDLFLFPSLYDTSGLVVREAAALGTPSVMARVASAASVIRDGENGFLTENDPESFAQLLRSLLSDPERVKHVGERARVTLVRPWEDYAEEALDRYNSLLRSRSLPLIEKSKD
jgi:glycosyltransferase involved in cell wall biosynthesis